ncbi:uncharacterized protein DEA37_0010535, partial [Paragonimus westermani]
MSLFNGILLAVFCLSVPTSVSEETCRIRTESEPVS